MKSLIVVLFFTGVAFAYRPELDEDWKLFKKVYKKQYDGMEEANRRYVFEKNVNHIEKHNRMYDMGVKNFRLEINKFADLTNKEFRHYYNGFRMQNKQSGNQFHNTVNVKALPDTVDWRDKKVVTDVKNQAQCGSCWAFSTTGSVEGAHALKTKKLVSLSEQNLVDCSGDEGNMGCSGGLMDQAFEYIIKNKGIDTEASYPYEGVDGKCRFNPNTIGATISSYKDVASGDESALQQAVAQVGPISVAIDASNLSFQFYSGGIYDEEGCSTTALDHGVLAVGYGTDNGQDYWLVKNSWDTVWGDQGYIKMSRNKKNQCGIATQASYPIV